MTATFGYRELNSLAPQDRFSRCVDRPAVTSDTCVASRFLRLQA